MRRIVLWQISTITIVVLLFGYHTSTRDPSTGPTTVSTAPATTSGSSGPETTAGSGPSASAEPPPETSTPEPSTPDPTGGSSDRDPGTGTNDDSTSKTSTGAVAETRWGPVQVRITSRGARVTAVQVLQSPSGNPRDLEINERALPILVAETMDAQDADIDMVSGATVTSDGYAESLQSALDRAGI